MPLHKPLLPLLALGCSLLVACDQFPSFRQDAGSTLAILDFPALLKATGMDEKVQQQLQEAGRILDQQLQRAAEDLNRQVTEARTAAGEKSSPEQQQELEALTVQANRQLGQVQQNARLKLQQVQADVITQLRDQVRPIAEAIARQHGAEAVLLSSESILWFDPAVDITAEVIAKVRLHPLELAPLPPGPGAETPAQETDTGPGKDADIP